MNALYLKYPLQIHLFDGKWSLWQSKTKIPLHRHRRTVHTGSTGATGIGITGSIEANGPTGLSAKFIFGLILHQYDINNRLTTACYIPELRMTAITMQLTPPLFCRPHRGHRCYWSYRPDKCVLPFSDAPPVQQRVLVISSALARNSQRHVSF